MAQFNQAMMDLYRYNGSILPQVRSMFSKNHSHATTFDSGYLIPVFVDRVLPGDEKKIRLSALCRMSTPKFPTMDGANLYFWAFYVPDRLWWNHAKEFYGENRDASFNPDGEYVMPYLKPSQYYVKDDNTSLTLDGVGSLNDYLGFPASSLGETGLSVLDDYPETYVTAGMHRSYHLIWNEHFRNPSIQPAEQLNDGDTVTDAEWNVIRKLKLVNKLPDRFTTLLREPQAGDDVYLPLGEWAPVVATRTDVDVGKYYGLTAPNEVVDYHDAMRLYYGTNAMGEPRGNKDMLGVNNVGRVEGFNSIEADGVEANGTYYAPANLWADLTSSAAATVNNIRNAVTIQHLLELDNLSGKLYETILAGHFNVFIPDAVTQRTQLLGVCKRDISMRQVLQTSESSDESPQGNPAGLSVTQISNDLIVDKAFLEGGFVMILAAVRPVHSYSQGINPLWQKLRRYDHYWPVFDRLGNQPVMTSEIYATNYDPDRVTVDDLLKPFNTVLGYRPAWDEYRTMSNRVSGLFRPEVKQNLSAWNYSSLFDKMPVLNSEFIEEDPELMDRTLAVTSEPQFLLDCYFEYTDSKNMSVNSVPGLTRL